MIMNALEEFILKYGSEKNSAALQKLLHECSEQELENLIKDTFAKPTFLRTWDFMLKTFQHSSQFDTKRIKVVMSFLNILENHSMSSKDSSALLQRLCMGLIKFPVSSLKEICTFCHKSILSKTNNINNSWKELLPDTLRILSEKCSIDYEGVQYTGQKFKTTFIDTLCMSNWPVEKITEITSMFGEMSLDKEEHIKVLNKLTSYIEKLKPPEIPPFVYQLLKFCRHQNGRMVFYKLRQYFQAKIYDYISSEGSSYSSNLDVIEKDEDYQFLEAEGMVLYHIHAAASIGYSCIKDYLNSLKATVKSPEFILQPFQLLVLLKISTVSQYEESAFEIMRYSIVRAYNDQQRFQFSYWFRDAIVTTINPEDVFQKIMNTGDRDTLLEAFSNFGFTLLGVGTILSHDIIAEKQWTLGTMILLKVIKKRRDVASILLKTFCNHILCRQSSLQYIECLYYLCKTSPLLIWESQSSIVELTESLMMIPNKVAKQLLEALMPLSKFSNNLRDQLILVLRKCLYSRAIETRQVAVFGYVKLLSTLDISNGGFLSQSTSSSFSSGFSLYTQISLNRTTQKVTSKISSEALCLEILEILKRCFMQQYEVKQELYEDLYEALCFNPDLSGPILEVVWFHLLEYYVMDETVIPPLNFNDIIVIRDTDCILQEPLGKLIFLIAQTVAKVKTSSQGSNSSIVTKFIKILDSLCQRMPGCELVYFELDDGTDFAEPLPETQKKLHILQEVINVFEALIGYKIANLTSDFDCTVINSLLEGYMRFYNFGKNLSRPRKGKKSNKSSQKDDKNNKLLKVFKPPETLLNFETVIKGLKALLETNITGISQQAANSFQIKKELHKHFILASTLLIGKLKRDKPIDSKVQHNYFNYITSIGEILFTGVIKRLNDYTEFDCSAAVAALECFNALISLIHVQYKTNITMFLSKIDDNDDKEIPLVQHLDLVIEELQSLFLSYEEDNIDAETQKLNGAILNIIISLCAFIPNNCNALSIQIYNWLKELGYNKQNIPVKITGSFMNLFCEFHIRFKLGLKLFEHVSNSFTDVFASVSDEDSTIEQDDNPILKIVTFKTGNLVLLSLCDYNKILLEDVEGVINRIKSDYLILQMHYDEDNTKRKDRLKNQEMGVISQLCFLVNILNNLISLLLPPGNLSDAVFRNIVQFYSTLNSLTKYYLSRSDKNNLPFQGVWFEKLVKLTGKKLSCSIYTFITEFEAADSCGSNTTQRRRRRKVESTTLKKKILKETKMIPKIVYEMEQFSKVIIQLSKKAKYDLSKYVGQGTARDFRINLETIANDLKRVNATEDSESTTTINDSFPCANSTSITEEEIIITSDDDDEATNNVSGHPNKRVKR